MAWIRMSGKSTHAEKKVALKFVLREQNSKGICDVYVGYYTGNDAPVFNNQPTSFQERSGSYGFGTVTWEGYPDFRWSVYINTRYSSDRITFNNAGYPIYDRPYSQSGTFIYYLEEAVE